MEEAFKDAEIVIFFSTRSSGDESCLSRDRASNKELIHCRSTMLSQSPEVLADRKWSHDRDGRRDREEEQEF